MRLDDFDAGHEDGTRDDFGDEKDDGGGVEADLSSDNPRSSCNAVKLEAAAGEHKGLLFPSGLMLIAFDK